MHVNQCRTLRSIMLFSAIFAAMAVATTPRPANAATSKTKSKSSPPNAAAKSGLNLTPREARFLRGLEKKLVTKLNSKNNPADRDTWYVLLLLDRAVVQKESASKSGSSLSLTQSMWVSTKPDGAVVQGRHEAALTLARFLVGENDAAKGLGRFATSDARTRSHVNGDKQWRFYYFKSEADARVFLKRALPPKKKTSK